MKNKISIIIFFYSISSAITPTGTGVKHDPLFQDPLKSSLYKNPLSEKQKEQIQRKIKKKIREEIRVQQRRKKRKAIKDTLAGRVRLSSLNKSDFLYKIPAWDFESQFYRENDLFQVEVKAQEATKAYSSSGHTQDLSKLVLSQKDIKVEDILLASKLLYQGKLDALSASDVNRNPGSQYHYFYLLAKQPLDFDASFSAQTVTLKYARHFLKGDVSFGIELPIKRRVNKIKLDSEISSALQQTLQEVHPNFYGVYNNLDDFVNTILNAQGINFNKHDTEWGFSDLKLSCNAEIDSRQVERCLVGASLTFPTAGDIFINKLWPTQLGNGGFVETKIFCSALWSCYSHFNPHIYISATGNIPARIERRVPQLITYDGSSPAGTGYPVSTFLNLGAAEVYFNNSTFSDVDATVANFARETTTLKYNKGAELYARFGNTIEHFFSHKASLDTFYDIRLKGKDYVRSSQNLGAFQPSYLTINTHEMENRLGITYLYQFSGRKRFSLEGLYTFLGRNVPETFEGSISFAVEF